MITALFFVALAAVCIGTHLLVSHAVEIAVGEES